MINNFFRQTQAEINLKNLEYNFKHIKSIIRPKTKILVPVKSDAYGHGLIPISKKLIDLGVDFLGVRDIDEAIKLREANIKLPILILSLIFNKDIHLLPRFKLTPTICSREQALILDKESARRGLISPIHIKIDTGMGRLGINYSDAFNFIRDTNKLKSIKIEGLFTHFPKADSDKEYTYYQISLFNNILVQLSRSSIDIPLIHAANSVGVLKYSLSHFNLIRPGIVIYGLSPKENLKLHLRPLMSVKTKIIFIKKVSRGQGISYGHTYIAKTSRYIATLPLGYGDGYPRVLSNKADVIINDKRYRIAGRVCMDQILVDLGSSSRAKFEDEVILLGESKNNKITASELADKASTIAYEIVCGFGRLNHVYIDK
ncbi:MAG: alanine racemase [Candidatus Omnitrophota bacterium]